MSADGPVGRLVLTAFGPFPGCPDNPTGRLAKAVVERLYAEPALVGWRAEVRELPTEWSAPTGLIERLAREAPPPDFVLSLGVRSDGIAIDVERVARNSAGVLKADQKGELPPAAKLVEKASERLEGRLHRHPFEAVVASAIEAGHPVGYSDDAGPYVCNALFFHLLNGFGASDDGPLVGFLHVPLVDDDTEDAILDGLVALVVGWCRVLETGRPEVGAPS